MTSRRPPAAPQPRKTAARPQFHWQGLHVPFIAPWSEESTPRYRVVERPRFAGGGIAYADEVSRADRRHDVLWVRRALLRGRGTPQLAAVHPLRQRQAMSHMLCQVCGETTFNDDFRRWGERHLFLARAVEGRPIHDGERTTTPPVCLPCAMEAVESCPPLRKGHAAALVERAQPWGVAGIAYDPRTLLPIPPKDPKDPLEEAAFEDPAIRWTLAARDVVTLHGCTPVDLSELATLGVAA
ncbi:hypothetical protein [Streptomyces sp. NPDC006012]|uniref:hypothetical protein n=1 Tax=Streptomyces sp. NPDC006012 TaxID=3364739 RepID=UPI003682F33F